MDALSLVLIAGIGFGGVYTGIASAAIVVARQEKRIEQFIADYNNHVDQAKKNYTF